MTKEIEVIQEQVMNAETKEEKIGILTVAVIALAGTGAAYLIGKGVGLGKKLLAKKNQNQIELVEENLEFEEISEDELDEFLNSK